MNVNLTINVEGDYTDEEIAQRMTILGELIINRIKENIRAMDLIDTSQLLQQWFSTYKNGQLNIENAQEYMIYLEFGTYAYWDQYGESNFPATMDWKKKDMPSELRKIYPKGMQPFAFIRKVVYNEIIMAELIQQAFS